MFADRVKETTTTTGTGTIDLGGAATGFQTFVAGIGTAKTCYYTIVGGAEWEVGIGTVTDAGTDTLSRNTVLASSNAGALVSFSAGTKDVFVTIPAESMELMQSTLSPAINEYVQPSYSAVVAGRYTIASGKRTTIGLVGRLKIL